MTTPITHATITRLRELLAAATAGPWAGMCSFVIEAAKGPHHTVCSFVNCDGDGGVNQRLVIAMRNAIPALLDKLASQAAEIDRWRSDWKRIAADEAVWYTLSDIFGVEGMTNAAGVVSGVTEKWNERQARVAELGRELESLRESQRKIDADAGGCALSCDGSGCNTMSELSASKTRVVELEALLLAVKCGEFSGITCDNVNGRSWFDARAAVLTKREGGR